MTTQGTFDDERLSGLHKELGPKVLGELIDIFLEEMPRRIESAVILMPKILFNRD